MRQSPDAPRKLRIVIPAYNEATRIRPTIVSYCARFDDLATVVVVATGCSDDTADVVRELQRDYANLQLLEVSRTIGKGGAVRVGFAGEEEFVGFVDADGATDAEEFARLFDVLQGSDAAAVIASRWLPGADVEPAQTFPRRAASRTFNAIVRSLFGLRIKDTQCGAKVLRRAAFAAVRDRLELADLAFDIDLIVALQRAGLTIREEPTRWSDRPAGTKIQLPRASWGMLKSVLRIRLRDTAFWRLPFVKNIARSSVLLPRDEAAYLGDGSRGTAASSPLPAELISIVMPAFNESEFIAGNLREVVETFSSFGANYEVILVDDGSHDNTYLHALRVLVEHPERVRVLRYDDNQGKGNALMVGAMAAKGEYVVFLDADMDLHPSQLPTFFTIMQHEGSDAVIGSKRHPGSLVKYPPLRKIYSAGYYAIVRALFGLPLRDTQTGLKLFRTELVKDVVPRVLAKRFAFDIEMLSVAHHLGYSIVDAPVILGFQRKYGRIKYTEVWKIFWDTLAIFYRLRMLRFYDVKHDVFGLERATVREMSTADAPQLLEVVD
jgi:glycosyltransferase involved in cell wall biosynthesis